MTLLSLSAFAKTHGATRQAAAKWRDRGAIVFDGDLVDVEKSDAIMKGAGLGRFKGATSAQQPRKPRTRNRAPVAPPTVGGVDEDDEGEDEEDETSDADLKDFVENLLQGRFLTKVGAARIKESALALKHLVAAKRAAGAVVDVELAEAVFFETARAERDAWMSFPTRVGPLLAADLDIETDRVVEALTVHVHQQLEQLGDPTADFGTGGAGSPAAGPQTGLDATAAD